MRALATLKRAGRGADRRVRKIPRQCLEGRWPEGVADIVFKHAGRRHGLQTGSAMHDVRRPCVDLVAG